MLELMVEHGDVISRRPSCQVRIRQTDARMVPAVEYPPLLRMRARLLVIDRKHRLVNEWPWPRQRPVQRGTAAERSDFDRPHCRTAGAIAMDKKKSITARTTIVPPMPS